MARPPAQFVLGVAIQQEMAKGGLPHDVGQRLGRVMQLAAELKAALLQIEPDVSRRLQTGMAELTESL